MSTVKVTDNSYGMGEEGNASVNNPTSTVEKCTSQNQNCYPPLASVSNQTGLTTSLSPQMGEKKKTDYSEIFC